MKIVFHHAFSRERDDYSSRKTIVSQDELLYLLEVAEAFELFTEKRLNRLWVTLRSDSFRAASRNLNCSATLIQNDIHALIRRASHRIKTFNAELEMRNVARSIRKRN